jgi:hypothetical protein
MIKAIILVAGLIVLGGSIAFGQDDSIPKLTGSDSRSFMKVEMDSIDDGYYLGQNYPNPF